MSTDNLSKKWAGKTICFLAFFFSVAVAMAQTKETAVMVNARAQKDKILVRWAINNPIEWNKALQKGFIVNRYTLSRDGKLLATPEKKILTPAPLVPEPLDSWADLAQKDNYAAIIAQAIYGDSFEVTGASQGALASIVNQAEELDQRYTFALYAADMSFDAALKAGWGLVDTDIKKTEIYTYQVMAFEAPNVKESFYAVGLKDYSALPAPTDFTAVPDDKKVVLSWDYQTFKGIYSSFMIEKSSDSIHFAPISKTPIVNMNDKADRPSTAMVYIDTLKANDQTFYYRLYGISSFGEKGELTPAISVKGVADVLISARLTDYHIEKDNSINLEWEYPKEAETTIAGFELNWAEKDQGPYTIIAAGLPASQRKYSFKNPSASNYFTISTVGKNHKRLSSHSLLVQPVDSIAPAKPLGLEGTIDSLGVVRLKWKANEERDLAGYRVLKANTAKEEFIDIEHKTYVGNAYTDKVNLQLTNPKVYYRIAAEDQRFNISELSAVLELEKPDKIPPTAPVFKNYNIKDGKVYLQWIRSYSDDVVGYSLRRREKGQQKWEEIKSINDSLQDYIDDKVLPLKTYQYAILARDKGNLWSSIEHATIMVDVLDFTPTKTIAFLQRTVEREHQKITLSWRYTKSNDKVTELSIYKNVKGSPPTLWKELSGNITTLDDYDLKVNTEYEYHFSPMLQSNQPAKTEKVTVMY